MKRLKTIANEMAELLEPRMTPHVVTNEDWKYYMSLTGFLDEQYYSITFSRLHGKDFKNEIEVCHTTKDPMKFVRLIKEIEPKAKVKILLESTTYTTKIL